MHDPPAEFAFGVPPQNPQNTLPGMRSMVNLIDWSQLLEPRSREEWRTAMATAIRNARYLPEEEIELLAQIAERGPPAKRGRKPYNRDKVSFMEALIDHCSTQGEADRRFAAWNNVSKGAAEKARRRHKLRMETKSARDDELFQAAMAYSKHVKALREVVRLAEFQKLRVKYDVDPK